MEGLSELDKRVAEASKLGTSVDELGTSAAREIDVASRAAEEGTVALVGRAASSLPFYSGAFAWAERSMFLPEQDFDLNSNWAELTKDIPNEYHSAFNAVRSREEGLFVRNDLMKDIENRQLLGAAGFRGQAASVMGSILDVDALLTTGTGGLYAGAKTSAALGKVGLGGTRMDRIASTAATGAEMSAVIELGNAAVRPTNDWTQVPEAALAGLVFGGAIGTVLPTKTVNKAQEDLNATREEFKSAKETGFPADPRDRPVRKTVDAEVVPEKDAPDSVKEYTVFRGDEEVISEFDPTKSKIGFYGGGVYFTPDEALAQSYGKNVTVAKVRLKNPYMADENPDFTPEMRNAYESILRGKGWSEDWIQARLEFIDEGRGMSAGGEPGKDPFTIQDRTAVLKAGGYDGVVAEKGNIVVAFDKSQISKVSKDKFDSVGASATAPRNIDPVFGNKDTSALLDEVRQANVKDGLVGDVWGTDSYFKQNAVSQAGKKLYNAVSKTPWASDFDYLWNSGSVIGQRLATQLLETPSGIGQMKNRTSAVLQTQYHTEVMVPVAQNYSTKYAQWLKEQNSTAPTPMAWNDLNSRQTFDRAVMEELQWRYHDQASAPTSSAAVREMADAIDEASARAAEVLKGRDGELPVSGSEDLKPTSGWYRQMWNGQNILKAVQRAEVEFGAKDGRKLIKDTLSKSYQKLHKWDKKTGDVVAGAVVNGAIARSDGVNTNLFRTMSPDNFEYLRQVLENDLQTTGLKLEEINKKVDEIMKRIQLDTADRGKIKPLKNRNDIDLREQIPGTDMKLMDLIDADINKTWTTYSRTVAGAASTARNGIQAHEIRTRWIPAIKDELASRGAKPLADGYYEALESYFSGRAYSGGLNPWVRRLLTTTNLAFLNSLGLTQLGELGATIGAMHLDNFVHALPKEIRYIFNGKLSPIHEDLKNIDSSIIGDHNIYQPHLMQNETRAGGMNTELTRNLDMLLAKGARTQGFVSGFYKVNQWMQRMSGNALINRIGQIANGKTISDLRAKNLGFTPQNESKIMSYFKDGTVEYRDGRVYDLHIDKWDSKVFQEFASIINRSSGQTVQKSFRGEDAWWMHKDTGAFLMHLKSFTFTAMHKQLIRNMRIADAESLATFLFGLGTAAAAYTARQYTSGNQEKMDGEKLMKGMLNYSNITAPIVQFTDPVFGVLGMDSLQIGNFGNAYNGNNSLLAMPPSFNAVNRISQIPAATARGVLPGVDMTKNDIYSLQAAPIMGNLYGMGYIANAMRDDIDARKRKQESAKKAKKVVEPKAPAEPKPTEAAKPPVKTDNAVIKEVIKMGGGE